MHRDRERGFTLLEMIVVVAVLALVGTLVLSRGPSRSPGLDLRAAANGLSGCLRLARAEAIAADRDRTVRLEPDGRRYGIDGTPGSFRDLPAGVSAQRGANGRLPPPVTFHPDGSATGGRIVLGEGALRRAVAVDWLTGAVSAS